MISNTLPEKQVGTDTEKRHNWWSLVVIMCFVSSIFSIMCIHGRISFHKHWDGTLMWRLAETEVMLFGSIDLVDFLMLFSAIILVFAVLRKNRKVMLAAAIASLGCGIVGTVFALSRDYGWLCEIYRRFNEIKMYNDNALPRYFIDDLPHNSEELVFLYIALIVGSIIQLLFFIFAKNSSMRKMRILCIIVTILTVGCSIGVLLDWLNLCDLAEIKELGIIGYRYDATRMSKFYQYAAVCMLLPVLFGVGWSLYRRIAKKESFFQTIIVTLPIAFSLSFVLLDLFAPSVFAGSSFVRRDNWFLMQSSHKRSAVTCFLLAFTYLDYSYFPRKRRERIERDDTRADASGAPVHSTILQLFCPSCGARFPQGKRFCDQCGSSLSVLAQPEVTTQSAETNAQDVPSKGMAVLGFFIPIAGFVLWASWNTTLHRKAKSAGIGALIGFITYIILTIAYCVYWMVVLSRL